MNALTKDLTKLVALVEEQAPKNDRFRGRLHLEPPTGWLNDPNGLCQFNGVYHAFFQYSPFDAEGGVKMWGHYTSDNMIDWNYQGTALYPDQPFDCHGVYSGSALIDDGTLYLYYTGNIKLEGGDYDYVNSGREANTILVTTRDGVHFSPKQELMRNSDYPSDISCHVRDPKVWKSGDTYYMIQGARTKEDTGLTLIFESTDKINWSFRNTVTTTEPYGYMWECPDYFEVDNTKILVASVQGLTGGIWEERNVYPAGYFHVEGDILTEYTLSDYKLLDYGFDFYAPQTFEAEDGRRILISWMGMADCKEYTNKTIADGWQHCFTFPRELFVENGVLCQRPIRELEGRKKNSVSCDDSFSGESVVYEAYISGISGNNFRAVLAEELILEYADGKFLMHFTDQDMDSVSAGRSKRYVELEQLTDVRILTDTSCVEVFLNNGAYVFSTRYYPETAQIQIVAKDAEITFAELV